MEVGRRQTEAGWEAVRLGMGAVQVRHLGHTVEGSVHCQGRASDSDNFTFVPWVFHLPHLVLTLQNSGDGIRKESIQG